MSVIAKSSVLAAILLGSFVASARAEDNLTVRIPFAFVVDHQQYPAGEYDIRTDDDSADVVWIEGIDHRSAAVTLTNRLQGRDPAGAQPALVFTHVDNAYQLTQIWESSSNGRELTRPSRAKHAGAETQSSAAETLTIPAVSK